MKSKRYYIYKCVVDDGGAPCVDEDVYSLTICKPYIRRTARKGDLIFAFGSNSDLIPNRLVYIAEVSRKVSGGKYFEEEEFRNRSDCIYERLNDGRIERKSSARYHEYDEARVSDLGDGPFYPNAISLMGENFRYFGKNGKNDWKANAPYLCELVEDLGQGHRVRFSNQLLEELTDLKERVWRDNPDKKVLGDPLHGRNHCGYDNSDELAKLCGRRCYIPKKKC